MYTYQATSIISVSFSLIALTHRHRHRRMGWTENNILFRRFASSQGKKDDTVIEDVLISISASTAAMDDIQITTVTTKRHVSRNWWRQHSKRWRQRKRRPRPEVQWKQNMSMEQQTDRLIAYTQTYTHTDTVIFSDAYTGWNVVVNNISNENPPLQKLKVLNNGD